MLETVFTVQKVTTGKMFNQIQIYSNSSQTHREQPFNNSEFSVINKRITKENLIRTIENFHVIRNSEEMINFRRRIVEFIYEMRALEC